ncbi:MFS transporter [Chloroflexota bacterium]
MSLLPKFRFTEKISYGWVILFSFLIFGTTIFGVRHSFGVFFKSIESAFDISRTTTSSLTTLLALLGIAFAILGGWALDKYGPRVIVLLMGIITGASLILTSQVNSLWQLFITYGILLAMGTSTIYVVITSTILRWFDKKQGLALGIGSSSLGIGMVIFPPFAATLIARLDWQTAYLVFGLIVLVITIPLSIAFKSKPVKKAALPIKHTELVSADVGFHPFKSRGEGSHFIPLLLKQALITRSFWAIMFIWLLVASSVLLVLTHLVPYVTDIGFTTVWAATLLSVIGGMTIIGGILMGALIDKVNSKKIAIICCSLMAGAIAWLLWSYSSWQLYLFAVTFGFAFGGIIPSIAALSGRAFGLHRIGSILGVLEIGYGAGAAIGPVIGGLIFDTYNSYFGAFLTGVCSLCLVPLLIMLIRREVAK